MLQGGVGWGNQVARSWPQAPPVSRPPSPEGWGLSQALVPGKMVGKWDEKPTIRRPPEASWGRVRNWPHWPGASDPFAPATHWHQGTIPHSPPPPRQVRYPRLPASQGSCRHRGEGLSGLGTGEGVTKAWQAGGGRALTGASWRWALFQAG